MFEQLNQVICKDGLVPQFDYSTRSELMRAGIIPADVGASLASTVQTLIPIADERARSRRVYEG